MLFPGGKAGSWEYSSESTASGRIYGPALAEKPRFHIGLGCQPRRPLHVGCCQVCWVASHTSGRHESAALFISAGTVNLPPCPKIAPPLVRLGPQTIGDRS